MSLTFRGLELHGSRIWQRDAIVQALDFAERHQMTALVLHESDIIHNLVFPRSWFDPYAQWKSAPARRGENALQNNRVYFDHVLGLAEARGIELWLEVKELAFPDEVLEARPELVKGGIVCPSEPAWQDFITAKTAELVADFPSLAGIVLSPGSPEGRAARAQNKCGCALCAATPLDTWYQRIIEAMHAPLKAAGKRLAVRDFAYKPANHAPLLAAVAAVDPEVIFCLKVTPHDFYPTFPDNPAISPRPRPQWVEYDTMGQFYGWGAFPCFMADDIRRRLGHAAGNGVSGGLFRVEWERINDWWALDNLNALNAVAAARLGREPGASNVDICVEWLEAEGYPAAAASWLAETLALSWPAIRDALYIDDFLFSDCSMFPRSVGRAWWTMEVKHSLEDWAPEYHGRLALDATRLDELLTQKRRARAAATTLRTRVLAGDASLPEALRARLDAATRLLELYTEGMELCADVCLRARWHPEPAPLAEAVARLEEYGTRIRPLTRDGSLSHQQVMQLDYRRVADIAEGGRAALAETADAL